MNFNNNIDLLKDENEKSMIEYNNNDKSSKSFIANNENKNGNLFNLAHQTVKTEKLESYKYKKLKINKHLNETNNIITRKYMIVPKYYHNLKTKNRKMPKKTTNFGKTLFSKATQMMFEEQNINKLYPKKNVINLEFEEIDGYNKLTEETYLNTYDAKPKENNKLISDFLVRKRNEQISKRIKLNTKKEAISDTLKDSKRANTLTDRNRNFKSTRTISEFIQDQNNFEEKHNILLKNNENKHKEEQNRIMRDRPLLNKGSINLAKKRLNNKDDIYIRLYKDFDEKKKKDQEQEKENEYMSKSKEKKVVIKDIEETTNRLFNEYKIRKKRKEKYMKDNQFKQNNMSFNLNKNSNEIIYKKLKKNIDNTFKMVFSKNVDEEFKINFNDYLRLLFNIGYTNKNYLEIIMNDKTSKEINFMSKPNLIKSNDNNNNSKYSDINKEYLLVKNLWKIITEKHEFDMDIFAKSTKVIFYIYKIIEIDTDENNIKGYKKDITNYINFKNSVNISTHNLYNINRNFHLFRKNAINRFFEKENNSKRKNLNLNQNNKNESSENINISRLKYGKLGIEKIGYQKSEKTRENTSK